MTEANTRKRANDAVSSRADAGGPRGWISFQLAALSNKLSKSAAQRVAANSGLTLAEWRVIALLGEYAPVTVSELAAVSGFDKSWISRSISALEERGIVARAAPSMDSRKTPFQLSKAGRAIFDREAKASERRNAELLGAFSEKERDLLFSLIGRLDARADELDTGR